MQNSIKLAAIDLDGTLLGPDKQISPENLAALRLLEADGVEILIATGRHLNRIAPYLAEVADARWAVTCQGASVFDLRSRRPLHAVFLTPAETRLLVDLGSRLGFSSVIYSEDTVRTLTPGPLTKYYGEVSGGEPVVTEAADLVRVRAHKVVWVGEAEAIARLPDLPEVSGLPLYHVRTEEHLYEFLPSDASKALGVAAVAERLGIRSHEVVAFGDGDNDIPLFRWAGRSFAMPHGTPAARESATETASPGAPESAFARAVEILKKTPCRTIS